jgi:hypothetical protein
VIHSCYWLILDVDFSVLAMHILLSMVYSRFRSSCLFKDLDPDPCFDAGIQSSYSLSSVVLSHMFA